MRRMNARAEARFRFPTRLSGLAGLTVIAALALAACGGGGDGGTPAQPAVANTPNTNPSTDPLLVSGLDLACTGCGAATGSTYAGSQAGVWGKANTTGSAIDVQYSISGLAGKTVSIMLSNLGDAAVTMPAGISSSVVAEMMSPQALSVASTEEAAQRAIGEYNRAGWVDATRASSNPMLTTLGVPAPLAASIGTTGLGPGASRSWYHIDGTSRPATLRQQVSASDGTVINIWVETTEAAAVTDTMVSELAAAFAGGGMVYDRLVGVGGALWGANDFGASMLPAGMPIDIVVLNFNRDGKAYGTVGYFWGLHNMLKTREPNSNESISLYLDSETLSLGGPDGLRAIKTTMAHEGTHMQNFYRRQVKMGAEYAYDTWLEEMTAMQMEDFLSGIIATGYNPIRDVRLPDYYRYSDYNCNLMQFTGFGATCESYAVSGSFGGFLNRQLGIDFYRELLTRKVSGSRQVLDAAITGAGWKFNDALVNWRITTNSTMPLATSPERYGYPAWTDGTFTLPLIDPSATSFTTLRKLPATAPSMLQGWASFIAPRTPANGVYSDKVRVPAGVTLSVVAY